MKLNYDKSPVEFFNAYHAKYDNENDLINPNWKLYQTKYHYNVVENGVIDLLRIASDPIKEHMVVMDVGSKSNHSG